MGDKTYTITSPVMGTFYRSSAPGEKFLVEEGQAITP
ncbi:MAG: acetyl-CoA carboxylase, biotin carboxyl carrier protein, partial [Desulfobacteraceae bacterium]|nr:acetyl-CoA carboxylase, biotin carboxyl carrier protein [Desulfobacteraceae bacterium]